MTYRAQCQRRRSKTMNAYTRACYRGFKHQGMLRYAEALGSVMEGFLQKSMCRHSLLAEYMMLIYAPLWVRIALKHGWISRSVAIELSGGLRGP
jgi:hypothetical protein